MKKYKSYDTVSDAINGLAKDGYTADFNIHPESDGLYSKQHDIQLPPEEFEIDATYRFEGETDPGDEMIVFAISAKNHAIKGILVNGYGVYADGDASKIVARLKKHL